jgi:Trypsin-co-occurring domain 2
MGDHVSLADYIEQLRSELAAAMRKGADADIRFLAKSAEIELLVAAEEKDQVSGKLEFKVFGVGLGGGGLDERAASRTQKIKLTLEPVGRDGKPPYISSEGRGGL